MPIMASRTLRHMAALGLFALATTLAGNTVFAAPADQLAQGETPAIDAQAMDDFVTAAKAIVALRQQYEPRMQAAGSEAAIRALVEEARGLMRTAITDTGMSVENYMAIAQAAQANPELRKRIEDAVGVPGQ